MNDVFFLHGCWYAVYNGRLSNAGWHQKGPAQAWLDGCIKKGKWRA